MKIQLVILSAGGTGGHVIPAQALAQDLLLRGFRVIILTDKRGLKFAPLFGEIPMIEIRAGTFGAGIGAKLRGGLDLGLGILQARRILKKMKPACVVGFGGYPSVPAVYAAQGLKIPTIIHEQNAICGKANAMLAEKATKIAIAMPRVNGLSDHDSARAVLTGNPVRPEISALSTRPFPPLSQDGALRILVMGGSLGAGVFSRIVPETLALLPPDLRARLELVQQCRAEDLPGAQAAYAKAGIKATLSVFVDDVAGALAWAHVFIGRSGASTVAEVTTAGRPAIFVPYPHHKDQQQKRNADTVADAGGAWVMTENGFTAEALLARIETFLQNTDLLPEAAEKARSCGQPDAALKLGNLVAEVVRGAV